MKHRLFNLLLASLIAVQLTCAQGSNCQVSLTDTIGSVQSPNYPSPYPANVECVWTIVLSGNQLRNYVFEFSDFNTEQFYDLIEIGSTINSTLFAFAGNKNPGQILLQNLAGNIVIRFHSDETVEARGFNLTYRPENEQDQLTHFAFKLETTFQQERSGTIRSHDVGSNYPILRFRQWYFFQAADTVTVFNVTRFETEKEFDTLMAAVGSDFSPNAFRQYTFSGTLEPRLFIMRSSIFNLVFLSDMSITGTGFSANFTVYPLRQQVINMTTSEGTISTNSPLEINQVLRWLIVPPAGCNSIEIDVEQLDFNNTDFFSLGRGDPATGIYIPLSTLPSSKIVITAARAFVEVQVSSHLEFSFRLHYKAMTDMITLPTPPAQTTPSQQGCFTELRAKSGNLTFSRDTSGSNDCSWRITVFSGMNVKVIFDHLDLAEGDSLTMGLRGTVGEHEILRINRDDNLPVVFTLEDSVAWLRLNSTGSTTMSLRFIETVELHTINFGTALRQSLSVNEHTPSISFVMTRNVSQALWMIDNDLQSNLEIVLISALLLPAAFDQVVIGSGSLYGDDRTVIKRNFGVKDNITTSTVLVPAAKAWMLLLTDDAARSRNGTFTVNIKLLRFTMPRLSREVPRSHLLLNMYADEQYKNKLSNVTATASMPNVTVKYDIHFELNANVSDSFYLEPPTCYYNATAYFPPKKREMIIRGCPQTSQCKAKREDNLTFRFEYQALFYGFDPTQEFELHCSANICDKRRGVPCNVEQCS